MPQRYGQYSVSKLQHRQKAKKVSKQQKLVAFNTMGDIRCLNYNTDGKPQKCTSTYISTLAHKFKKHGPTIPTSSESHASVKRKCHAAVKKKSFQNPKIALL